MKSLQASFFPSAKNMSQIKLVSHFAGTGPSNFHWMKRGCRVELPSRNPEEQTGLILCGHPADHYQGCRPHPAVFTQTTLPLTSTELLSEEGCRIWPRS